MKAKIFFTLLKKDLRLFVFRRHYAFFCTLFLLTTSIGLVSGCLDYQRRNESFVAWREIQSKSLNALQYAHSLRGPGYSQSFQPSALSILVYGAEDLITSSFETREWTKQFFGNTNTNYFIASFIPRMDLAVLNIFIVPIFLIFLLNGFARSEIEDKTLLSCRIFGVRPFTIVLSKLISSFLPVFLVSAVAIAAGFSVAAAQGVPLSEIGERYCMFVASSGLYILFWIGLLLVLQLAVRNALKVTAVSVLVWVTIVFVIPAAHIASLADHSGGRILARYFETRQKHYNERVAQYNYYDDIKSVEDIDPFSTYALFSAKLEKDMLSCDSCVASPLQPGTLSKNLLAGSVYAKLSPSFLLTIIFSEGAGTGLSDFLNFRRSMFDYFGHFVQIMNDPAVLHWLKKFTDQPPLDVLRKMDVQFSRVEFGFIQSSLAPFFLCLLLLAFGSALVFLLIGSWFLHRALAFKYE